MILKTFTLVMAISFGAMSAQAASTDFIDLSVGDEFEINAPNNTILSSGIEFTVIGPSSTESGTIWVTDEKFVDEPVSGTYLFFNNSVGVTLDLGPTAEALSFSFGSTFSDVTLTINGSSVFANNDLVQLDQKTIDDVLVSVDSWDSAKPYQQGGTITLTGDINNFTITGTELAFDNFTFDNVTTAVPEPGIVGAACLAFGLMLLRRPSLT